MLNNNYIKGIFTLRETKKEVYRDVVYEWEEDISKYFNIPLIQHKTIYTPKENITRKIQNKFYEYKSIKKINYKKPIYIAFITTVTDIYNFQKDNCIPIYIDVWNDGVYFVADKMKQGNPFFVTSSDVYHKLKNIDNNLNVYYIPLFVSDRWIKEEQKKDVDLIQMGRKNNMLHELAITYSRNHPSFNYVYSDKDGTTGSLVYTSTINGIIGSLKTRNQYMNWLKRAKYCLISSPTVDNSRNGSYDIDFPTPRFYEAAVCRCIMIGRYGKQKEFKNLCIDRVVSYINSYDDLELYLSGQEVVYPNNDVYNKYVNMHTTAYWCKIFEKKIDMIMGYHR